MAPPDHLRVIDFDTVSPLRSQTLWHAIPHGVSAGEPSTLSFVRPSDPYVSIGYHRRIEEVDTEECERRGWPVYRRMVGGGPVYLDRGQLFFQITVPMADVPASRHQALNWLLSPAVEAYRSLGIDAEIDDHMEIVVGDRKICGYGAGQIGDAAIVVGNLIETFDHESAAALLRTPSKAAQVELARLMQRYVMATPADADRFREAATDSYSRQFGIDPQPGGLTTSELEKVDELDQRFVDPDWLSGSQRPVPDAWQVKVRAGVFMFSACESRTTIRVGVDNEHLVHVELDDPALNGETAALQRSLIGLDLTAASAALGEAGEPGRRLSRLLDMAEPSRL